MKYIYAMAAAALYFSIHAVCAQEPQDEPEQTPAPLIQPAPVTKPVSPPTDIQSIMNQLGRSEKLTQEQVQALVKQYNLSPEAVDLCRANDLCRSYLPDAVAEGKNPATAPPPKQVPILVGASAGGAVQTRTGFGAQVGGNMSLNVASISENKAFQLVAPRLKLDTNAVIGSTASGQSALPVLQANLAVTGKHPVLPMIDTSNPVNSFLFGNPIDGKNKQKSEVGVNYDRNTAIGRPGRLFAYAGTASVFGNDEAIHPHYISLMPLLRLGFGVSNGAPIPFGVLGLKVDGKDCPWISESKKHALCLDGTVVPLAGLIEVGGEAKAGAYYQYTISDDPASAVRTFSIGPQVTGEAKVDWTGLSAAGMAGAGFKIQ